MSRSNPQENGSPNPATRWFEWNGEAGCVRFYDREAKKNVDVGSDFSFVLLDELGGVGGWHDPSQSAIYSNEVKDTRQESLSVRAFKGGVLAEGLYRDIKDRIAMAGGQFTTNAYMCFKDAAGALAIGSLRFKGAALGSWMEFRKANRAALYTKGIRIHGFTEGKKGRIVFRVPILKLVELTPETHAAATALDVQLQEFLDGYLKRNKREQVDVVRHREEHVPMADPEQPWDNMPPMTDDDIPF